MMYTNFIVIILEVITIFCLIIFSAYLIAPRKSNQKGQQMITIDQLLESVDLDFEPRFVTKDKNGIINIYSKKPKCGICSWIGGGDIIYFERIKLAEFADKPWQECIYEVPRKITGKIKKIEVYGTLLDYKFNPTGKFEPMTFMELIKKINELVDAVNKLKSCTKNMQLPYVRLYTCSDGAVFDNEDTAKSHEASMKNKQSMN